ncbi:hypothetical protein BROUX41_003239 [Berkeleyomyces rouxiae]|uniref:uncharacterized protein n=1 Tax=Berkeleyomyces rouxiae TaxID=2035830 RepID=UPI003B806877
MCHGLPHLHQCSHTSLKWNYCLGARLDLQTGYATPCSKRSIACIQPTMSKCQLKSCFFTDLGSRWTCCMCNSGPNGKGWCEAILVKYVKDPQTHGTKAVETFCSHGCCENCMQGSPDDDDDGGTTSKDIFSFDGRKGKGPYQYGSQLYNHNHGSAMDSSVASTRWASHPSSAESSYEPVDGVAEYQWSLQQQQQQQQQHHRAYDSQAYSTGEGYGHYGNGEYGTEENVWINVSPCSSRTSSSGSFPSSGRSVVLDYSSTSCKTSKGKRKA